MVLIELPPQPTPFIGREKELAEIIRLLSETSCRLLTLFGPGGIGKTRLALEAAGQQQEIFPDGVVFVALQPLVVVDYMISAIAEAVHLPLSGQELPLNQLVNFFAGKRLLLVLDNFEHLLDGAFILADLLSGAPGLRLLVTSREVLNLQEEWLFPVYGLDYPHPADTIKGGSYSAIQLFAERARRVQKSFSLENELACVIRICQMVEGMPLALELAAAWCKTLPCREVAAEIERSLDFLATNLRNIPERHRTVRAVFEQSWALLSQAEQNVFAALSVFLGGFDTAAAKAVAGASPFVLQGLMDKSLLIGTPAGRYEIHELLRQFAFERLAAHPDEQRAAQNRHCDYYTRLIAEMEPDLKGPQQARALLSLDPEIDNLRQAWNLAVEHGRREALGRALGGLALYLQMRSRIHDGFELFARAVDRFPPDDLLGGELAICCGWFSSSLGSMDRGLPFISPGLQVLVRERAFDGRLAFPLVGIVFSIPPVDGEPYPDYLRQNLEAYRLRGDVWGQAWMLYGLGSVLKDQGDLQGGIALLEKSLETFRLCGDHWGSTWVLNLLGMLYVDRQLYGDAESVFQAALDICRELGDPGGVSYALHFLGGIANIRQEYEGSFDYLVEAIRIDRRLNSYMLDWHLFELSEIFWKTGRKERAVEILGALMLGIDEEDTQTLQEVRSRLDAYVAEMPSIAAAEALQQGERKGFIVIADELLADFGSPAGPIKPVPAGPDRPVQPAHPDLLDPLTERELEVLGLVAQGLSNREIAGRLMVSLGTVKKHLNNIFSKLHVENRTQAGLRARQLGLLN